MRRKTIQLAGRTLVLSLPSKWARQNNVKKGDELDITLNNDSLTISCNKEPAQKTTRIDISNINYSTAWHYIISAYCNGFNEIEVIFDKPTLKDNKNNKTIRTADAILKITENLIGVEIIKQNKNSCIIKEITKIQKDEFHNILRRLFYLILSIAEDSCEALKNKDKNALQNILLLENNVNKFSHYCLRTQKEKDYSFIIKALEMISDKYCFIIKNIKAKNNELKILNHLNKILKDFHQIFYNLDTIKFNNYHTQTSDLKKQLLKQKFENKYIFIDILDLTLEILNTKLFIEN